jgi:hypothetical protein
MATWSFLTKHARVLVCIAHDPGVRLRDIAATVGITERSAYGIVAGEQGITTSFQAGVRLMVSEEKRGRWWKSRKLRPTRRSSCTAWWACNANTVEGPASDSCAPDVERGRFGCRRASLSPTPMVD